MRDRPAIFILVIIAVVSMIQQHKQILMASKY